MHSEIVSLLEKNVTGSAPSFEAREVGDQVVYIDASSIKAVCEYLKSSSYEFNVLQVITACDYEDRIELSYILASFIHNHELILKTKLPKVDKDHTPEIESITSLWKAANFLERECYDMLGVIFKDHPDFRRILCPEDWEGFPLRKDYVVQEKYHDMVVNPPEKINDHDHFYFQKLQEEIGDPKKVSFSWKD